MTKDQAKIKTLLKLPLFRPYTHKVEDSLVVSTGRYILASDTSPNHILKLVKQCNFRNTDQFYCFYEGGPKDIIFGFYKLTYFNNVHYHITVFNKDGNLIWTEADVDDFVDFLKKKN